MMAVLCYGRLQSYFYFLMLIVRILFPFEFFYVTFFLMFCLLIECVFVYDEKVFFFFLRDNLLFSEWDVMTYLSFLPLLVRNSTVLSPIYDLCNLPLKRVT